MVSWNNENPVKNIKIVTYATCEVNSELSSAQKLKRAGIAKG